MAFYRTKIVLVFFFFLVAESNIASTLSDRLGGIGRRFRPSLTGGALRIASKEAKQPSGRQQHVVDSKLLSFAVDGAAPLSLSAFQDFVYRLPRGIVRGKGTVLFRDDHAAVSYDFHLSGNGRHVDMTVAREGASSVQLAFIGRAGVDLAELQNALNACSAVDDAHERTVAPDVVASVLATVRADQRFEALVDEAALLYFRVTADHIGIPEVELKAVSWKRVDSSEAL